MFLQTYFQGHCNVCVVQTFFFHVGVVCFCRPIFWVTVMYVLYRLFFRMVVLSVFVGLFPGSLWCICCTDCDLSHGGGVWFCRPISWVTVVYLLYRL